MVQDSQTAALLDHIFSQTQANIQFLESQNYIPPAEAKDILSRLAAAQNNSRNVDSGIASSMQALALAPAAPPPQRRSVPPPRQPRTTQARALWAYNEDGRVRIIYLDEISLLIACDVGGERLIILGWRNCRDY